MSVLRNVGRAGATVTLIDIKTRKVVATAVADARGIATFGSVPPGDWYEQVQFQLLDSGVNKTITVTSGAPIDFAGPQASANGPILTASDGSLWQILVSTGGALSATKLAN